MKEVTLTIDGKEVKATTDMTILDVAKREGIDIPTLCYDKRLPKQGSCRICVVEVEGARTLSASCVTPVCEGMKVHTNSERVKRARQMIMKLILSNHPLDCFICDRNGDCELQDLTYKLGVRSVSFNQENRELPIDALNNPFIFRDFNKCVLCGRCVRVCSEVQMNEILSPKYRGHDAIPGVEFDKGLEFSNCVFCGQCVSVCPVGALVGQVKIAKARAWDLKKVKTICPYCGVGCELVLNVHNNEIIKVDSDEDSVVNKGNLCIKGRFGFEFVNSNERLTDPLIKEGGEFRKASWDEALDLVASNLKRVKEINGPDAIAGLSSAKATNEDNYLFQKFMRAVIGTNNVDHCARV